MGGLDAKTGSMDHTQQYLPLILVLLLHDVDLFMAYYLVLLSV